MIEINIKTKGIEWCRGTRNRFQMEIEVFDVGTFNGKRFELSRSSARFCLNFNAKDCYNEVKVEFCETIKDDKMDFYYFKKHLGELNISIETIKKHIEYDLRQRLVLDTNNDFYKEVHKTLRDSLQHEKEQYDEDAAMEAERRLKEFEEIEIEQNRPLAIF